jgi:transposase
MEAALLFEAGESPAAVARKMGVSRVSAGRWRARWHGVGLRARKGSGRPCRLNGEQLRSLYALWETRDKWTTATFAEAIYAAVGVKYDRDHVGRMIIRLGLRPARARKVGQMALVEDVA